LRRGSVELVAAAGDADVVSTTTHPQSRRSNHSSPPIQIETLVQSPAS
jgi:hypothetical protein